MPSLNWASETFHHLNIYLAGLPHLPLNHSEANFFDTALRLAATSYHHKAKVGALIVQKNRILISGVNSHRTHPFAAKWKPISLTLCAEMDCLLQAQKDPNFNPQKSTMYVGRVGKTGAPRISYPCQYCMSAMLSIGLNKFVCTGLNGAPAYLEIEG